MSSRPIASRTGARVGAAALAAVVLVTGTVLAVTRPWEPPPGPPPCPPAAYQATQSVARRWDDALLDAIRRALPNPPVHARNLFHVSVAMWDAWAAYDPTAMGYLFKEKLNVDRCDVGAARNEAISYAAYRVLTARFIKAVGAEQSLSEFADLMDTLSYPTSLTTTDGDTPAAVGNRIAKMVLEYGLADGSNEANGYAAPNYKPVNPPLVVALPDIRIVDPNRWQPLQVEFLLSQNGVVLPSGVQTAVGPHWGHVTSFAIPPGGAEGVPFDPGPPPRLGDPTTDTLYKTQALEVIRDSSLRATRRSTSGPVPSARTLLDPTAVTATPAIRRPVGPTRRTSCVRATSTGRSPSSGPTARTRRPRRVIGTSSRTRSLMRLRQICGSAARVRSSIGSSGT